MNILNAIQGNRVYLDTNIWIYALEEYPIFVSALRQLFQNIDEGNLAAVTSELTLIEVLVKPFRDGNSELRTVYRQAIQSSGELYVVPISRDVLVEAAQLRANLNLKLADAIHAATALLSECSTFLTNDQRFQIVPGFHVVLLSQVASP